MKTSLKDNSLISKLKLHTSYGLTGNSEIGTYKSLATVSQSNTIIGDALHVVSYLDNMPNPDLKWEKTGQWDLGFELGLFNNRLNFDISYYYKCSFAYIVFLCSFFQCAYCADIFFFICPGCFIYYCSWCIWGVAS